MGTHCLWWEIKTKNPNKPECSLLWGMITHPLCQHTHSGHLPKQEAKGLMYYEPLKDTKKSQFSGVLSLLAYAVLCFSHKRCFRQREFQSSTIFLCWSKCQSAKNCIFFREWFHFFREWFHFLTYGRNRDWLFSSDTHCNKVIPCLEDLQPCLIHQVGHLTASLHDKVESIHQPLTKGLLTVNCRLCISRQQFYNTWKQGLFTC